jgi:hypothetical protein
MSEWLDLMLEEIARKKREARDAQEEIRRREQQASDDVADRKDQSK